MDVYSQCNVIKIKIEYKIVRMMIICMVYPYTWICNWILATWILHMHWKKKESILPGFLHLLLSLFTEIVSVTVMSTRTTENLIKNGSSVYWMPFIYSLEETQFVKAYVLQTEPTTAGSDIYCPNLPAYHNKTVYISLTCWQEYQ